MLVGDSAERIDLTTDDGRRLVGLDCGTAGDVTVLFHMGTPNGIAPMPSFLASAFEGLRAVFYARPGYGESTRQPGRKVVDAVSDSCAILDALQVDQFVTIGWSGGGPHALACSALLPERCLATAIMASAVPYVEAVELRDFYEQDEDNRLALAGDLDGFQQRCDQFAAEHAHDRPEDIAGWFACEADKAALIGDYAEWMALYVRSAFASGGAGVCDDWVAFLHAWGFDLEDAGRVAIWHGDQDQNAPLAFSNWLADRIPGSTLRVLQNEGHMSIARRMDEIVDDLLARAGRSRREVI
jgi:pimeloyl-ACP methyl ester carboxylesterase